VVIWVRGCKSGIVAIPQLASPAYAGAALGQGIIPALLPLFQRLVVHSALSLMGCGQAGIGRMVTRLIMRGSFAGCGCERAWLVVVSLNGAVRLMIRPERYSADDVLCNCRFALHCPSPSRGFDFAHSAIAEHSSIFQHVLDSIRFPRARRKSHN